jgi:hypothetical protein
MVMLPGAKIRTVFTSRWKALYWSLGVMITAYCSIPDPDTDPNPETEQVAKTVTATPTAEPDQKNRWEKPGRYQAQVKPEPSANAVIVTDVLGQKLTQKDIDKLNAAIQ